MRCRIHIPPDVQEDRLERLMQLQEKLAPGVYRTKLGRPSMYWLTVWTQKVAVARSAADAPEIGWVGLYQ